MKIKENFLRILKELMYEKSLTFVRLGKDIGINNRTIRRWYEERSPKLDSLIKIADYFHCSLDFLVGLSTTEFDFTPKYRRVIFLERYKQLKESLKLNDAEISKRSKISSSAISKWNKGSLPNFEYIATLCKVFDCSFEYLIGRVD